MIPLLEPPEFMPWMFTHKEAPTLYWQIEIQDDLRLAMLDLLAGRKVQKKALQRVETAVMAARRMDLPSESLEWAEIEDAAKDQGISEADVLYDRMHPARPDEPEDD